MSQLKPYYRLLNSAPVTSDEPCQACGSFERIRDTWIEDGQGVVPDDYRYVLRCACDPEGEFQVEE